MTFPDDSQVALVARDADVEHGEVRIEAQRRITVVVVEHQERATRVEAQLQETRAVVDEQERATAVEVDLDASIVPVQA
jgi:hypothetical protein